MGILRQKSKIILESLVSKNGNGAKLANSNSIYLKKNTRLENSTRFKEFYIEKIKLDPIPYFA